MSSPITIQLNPSTKQCEVRLDYKESMASIQRFVGLMGLFNARGTMDPLKFGLSPVKARKAKLLFDHGFYASTNKLFQCVTHPTVGRNWIPIFKAMKMIKQSKGELNVKA